MSFSETSLAPINDALIYYEVAGSGRPLVMIHAGVADSRQWNNEFAFFQESYRVLRYDMRGYGKSEPVEGGFSHMKDLISLLDHTHCDEPLILMGCSMGGTLAMDFALANPSRADALIMVGSGPSGLQLDVPPHPKEEEAVRAYEAGDLDLLAELETQIWFDGMGRSPEDVDQSMRQLAYEMNRKALDHEAKKLGLKLADAAVPAAELLAELRLPVLIIMGANDIPYLRAAADYMVKNAPRVQRIVIENAAHLPNMDHPDRFQEIVSSFLSELGRP